MDVLVLFLGASATALATGLGAIPVFLLGERVHALAGLLWGIASGTMGVAAFTGLLLPAFDEGSPGSILIGIAFGVAFVVAAERWLEHEGHAHPARTASRRQAILVFGVLFVHSLPEGLAMGTAHASDVAGLSLFVIVAIGVHNIPEGTAVALPMAESGDAPSRQFWAAVLTSVPQPIGALVAYAAVQQVEGLLPISFGFAAGAMLALVALETAPRALEPGSRRSGIAGVLAGAALMIVLGELLGVE